MLPPEEASKAVGVTVPYHVNVPAIELPVSKIAETNTRESGVVVVIEI